MIVGSDVSDVGKLSLLVLYCVIYALPLIAIVVVAAIMGERRRAQPAARGRVAVGSLARGRCTAHRRIRDRRVVPAFGIVQLSST
jgi:hypothetical protein